MSFVINAFYRSMNIATRSNATAAVMNANQSLMNLTTNAGHLSADTLFHAEKQLTLASLQNQLKAKMAEQMEAVNEKNLDKSIKSSFSTFA